jgi:hypothetical protein
MKIDLVFYLENKVPSVLSKSKSDNPILEILGLLILRVECTWRDERFSLSD